MYIDNIFNNFIASEDLNLDNKLLEEFCLHIMNNTQGRNISNRKGFQSHDINLPNDNLDNLLTKINDKLKEVYKRCGLKKDHSVNISQVWINVNSPGSSNSVHNHPNSLFSGVYYVKAEENSGDIVFSNPNNLLSYTLYPNMIETYNEFNSAKWYVTPNTGKLIIFPSWLEHSVEENSSVHQRISIAFNTEFV